MEIKGTVKEIFETRYGQSKVTGKPWKKKEFLLKYLDEGHETYQREVLFQVMGDKTEVLSKLSSGDTVSLRYNMESRQNNGTGNYFTNITAYEIHKVE